MLYAPSTLTGQHMTGAAHCAKPCPWSGILRTMSSAGTPDWSAEISLLRTLVPVASSVHVVTSDALWRGFKKACRAPNGEHDQAIVTIKLITEAMFALEDLAALCLAVRNRASGIAYQYRKYKIGDPSEVYKHILQSGFPWSYLRIFAPPEYINDPDAENPNALWDLNSILGSAASWHQAPKMLELFNRSKHGFFIVKGSTASQLDVITSVAEDGAVTRVVIDHLREWCDRSRMVIQTCSDGWRALANLVIFMHERGYDLSDLPST